MMEPIEILSCIDCGRTMDQYTMIYGCPRCGAKLFRLVTPTKFRLIAWFINEPKHVTKLILRDIREKISLWKNK